MQLLLKNRPLLDVRDDGVCRILDFDRLPFALRKETVAYADFVEWAANRTLSISRSYAKEILNALRLSQNNRYAVCKACRGLSLEDSYWIRQEGDESAWEQVNLFENPLTLFITEVSLSGRNERHRIETVRENQIHTPELTTFGVSAKGWIRQGKRLCLHKVGRYEIPADEILTALGIPHVSYRISQESEIRPYLTRERMEWIAGVGEAVVNCELYTTEDVAMVTFEEFQIFCENWGLDPFAQAVEIDRKSYLQMQIADYLLNNNDRHGQNWGFLMDNHTGKLTGYFPLFDHDHAFCENPRTLSQTARESISLREAALKAQKELRMDLSPLDEKKRPAFLSEQQWAQLLARKEEMAL